MRFLATAVCAARAETTHANLGPSEETEDTESEKKRPLSRAATFNLRISAPVRRKMRRIIVERGARALCGGGV